jgi:ubiquinone/menaquinone biosynthesis C-methylase UbiE
VTDVDRIRNVYEQDYSVARTRGCWSAQWSPRNVTAMYFRQRVERELVLALNRTGIDFEEADVLDVGCGSGTHLRFFADLGADRARLHGIDLVRERIVAAKRLAPDLDFIVGDATSLPYGNASFDVVSQFTALCNIKDVDLLRRAAAEMTRVAKPDGSIIWFGVSRSPRQAPYRAITAGQLRSLFRGWAVIWETHLFHRWTEMLAGRFPDVCAAIERLPVPKSNLLAVLRR